MDEVIDWLNKVINESIMGSALIRVLNAQQPESQKFLEKNMESRDLGITIVRLFSFLIPIIMFVSNLAVVAILALGGHYVVMGTLSLGNFAAFNSYLTMLIFPVMMIGFMSNIIASATASHGRIKQVLDQPPPQETGTVQAEIKGKIDLAYVFFSIGEKPKSPEKGIGGRLEIDKSGQHESGDNSQNDSDRGTFSDYLSFNPKAVNYCRSIDNFRRCNSRSNSSCNGMSCASSPPPSTTTSASRRASSISRGASTRT